MTPKGGNGAFHQYLKMEMSTDEYGTFPREVMLHVERLVNDFVPEADRFQVLQMLFCTNLREVRTDVSGKRVYRRGLT